MSISNYAIAQLIRALPRVPLSRVVGSLSERALPQSVSKVVQKVYCSAYEVNLNEADHAGPYPSFDAFFTRPLKDGARPLADCEVISPSDGKISALGPMESDNSIVVKKQRYSVAELIGDAADARRYEGGQFAVVYLAPHDYHRVHSPVDGVISQVRGISGDLYPVNSIGEEYFEGLFVRNNRVCICIDTEKFGRVSVVMVGATIVGRISVSAIAEKAVPPGNTELTPAHPVARGEEIGKFHLGSTAVVLFEPGVNLTRSLGVVRMGESLVEAV